MFIVILLVYQLKCIKCFVFNLMTGEHDVNRKEGYEQIIQVEKIIKHPNYDSYTLDYDVALVKLKNPFKFTINVRPVCLPTTDFAPGTDCYITGWGHTTEGGIESQVNNHFHQSRHSVRPSACSFTFNDSTQFYFYFSKYNYRSYFPRN